jgi:hypothetical protein
MMKLTIYNFLNLLLCFILMLSSCTKTADVHPIFQAAFKPIESTTFFMVCDSLADTIKYETNKLNFSYDKGIYSSTDWQSISVDASIKDEWQYLNLLSLKVEDYGTGSYELFMNLNLNIASAAHVFQNNPTGFQANFNNSFVLNGTTYEQCYYNIQTGSTGESYTTIIYSPIYGVLRLVDISNGAVYLRCFECQ